MAKATPCLSTYFGHLSEGAVFAMPNRLPGARYIKIHTEDRTVNGVGLYCVYREDEGGAVGYCTELDINQAVWLAENVPPGM